MTANIIFRGSQRASQSCHWIFWIKMHFSGPGLNESWIMSEPIILSFKRISIGVHKKYINTSV